MVPSSELLPNLLSAWLPIARNPDGSSIVANMIVEQIFDNRTGTDIVLPFAAANLEYSKSAGASVIAAPAGP